MSEDPGRYVCPNCAGEMDGLKCKIRCPRCGYFESCSDLEPAPPYSSPEFNADSPTGAGPEATTDAHSPAASPSSTRVGGRSRQRQA